MEPRGSLEEENDWDGDHTECSFPPVPCTHVNLLLNQGGLTGNL